ncbi:MAG: Luciferase-like monooxygenase, partial [Ilumatobacteraceae bacterium]|nr:Luciferase-like monooxygenase [Ilumatobacteraceae bacterium]
MPGRVRHWQAGPMKIRIGFGLGTHTSANDARSFGDLVDALEDLRYDSLWLSERLTGDGPDPLTALAFAAGRTRQLKLGTSVLVVPGRNPVVLAKEMASLDRLSGGRFLPAVGLGAPTPVEHQAFGVERKDRAAWFDEALGLMRRLWTEDGVTHHGERFRIDDVTLRPRPVQQPIDVWLGGQAPSELRRVGRLGDGWLPSFCTADDVAEGWAAVTASAAEHGRAI